MDITRINNILESGEVKRFHAVPHIPSQTTGLHAWGVALIGAAICSGKPSVNLLLALLLHDTGELITGDIPFTAKRGVFKDIRGLLDAGEQAAMEEYLWPMPKLDEREETILKLADMLEGFHYANLNEVSTTPHEGVHRGLVAQRWWNSLLEMFATLRGSAMSYGEVSTAYGILRQLATKGAGNALPHSFEKFVERYGNSATPASSSIPHISEKPARGKWLKGKSAIRGGEDDDDEEI